MSDDDGLEVAALLLSAAGSLVGRINEGVTGRGFTGLRPAHGFAFVRLSRGGASAAELAEHLGVTKQAAGQMIDELERKGYVRRGPHPTDARARLVVLTEKGWACTRAAEEAAAEALAEWRAELGGRRLAELRRSLGEVARPGPVRPAW
ncbi:MarR family winged helix-turn-helix transcriptional regulator [Nocardiopsis composta]|uniref:DNA-binding MarR family transcriptional regulator n=1 Tax=Nocardiopsis composta TaxID=157465 RepID=A0A7W8QQ09_9ACTN|nr:MarR family transcriptional regulator [Nocardiopsis composta]MBB5433755.1 DNA-binding MarR family transcriptional regulator [Nocardiopsis composta]